LIEVIDMKEHLARKSGVRYICLVCKEALSDLDLSGGYAVCSSCRQLFNPVQHKDQVMTAYSPIVVVVSDRQPFGRLVRFHSRGR